MEGVGGTKWLCVAPLMNKDGLSPPDRTFLPQFFF